MAENVLSADASLAFAIGSPGLEAELSGPNPQQNQLWLNHQQLQLNPQQKQLSPDATGAELSTVSTKANPSAGSTLAELSDSQQMHLDDRDPRDEPEERFDRHRSIRGGQAVKRRREAYIWNAAADWDVPEESVPVYHTGGHSRHLNTSKFWEPGHSRDCAYPKRVRSVAFLKLAHRAPAALVLTPSRALASATRLAPLTLGETRIERCISGAKQLRRLRKFQLQKGNHPQSEPYG